MGGKVGKGVQLTVCSQKEGVWGVCRLTSVFRQTYLSCPERIIRLVLSDRPELRNSSLAEDDRKAEGAEI
jgi:hypothetical protein